VTLVLAALAIGIVPRLGSAVQAAAVRFQDQGGYNATVLAGARITHPVTVYHPGPTGITTLSLISAGSSLLGAVLVALLALYWRRLPALSRATTTSAWLGRAMQVFQSGVVNDYVTWIVVGLACIGGAVAAATTWPGATTRSLNWELAAA
jgi:hypothetical protein